MVFALLFLCGVAAAAQQQFAPLGDFKLDSGDVIRDCRIGYRTYGTLNAQRSNVVLVPTWAGGKTEQMEGSFVPGGFVDPQRYFIIAIDALSNGVSSSPSNSAVQPRMSFPKYTMRDLVRAEHEVLLRVLQVEHLHAVVGTSMGGMQAFQWAVQYPEMMDKVIPIVGSPRLAAYDVLHWTTQVDIIQNDPHWNGGNYQQNPATAIEFEMGEILLTTPEKYNREHTREQVLEAIEKAKTAPNTDANDKIRQVDAMLSIDVSGAFAGSMERAAQAVKAQMLIIVSPQDHVVTPEPAIDFAHLAHAELLPIQSDCGHMMPSCEGARVNAAINDFLGR
ncbi:MAG TPA: alpha/beta fold hydrolase [Terriglobales bacterium]